MPNVKTIAKRLLSADVQTLIQGGLLSSDLTITERGRAAVDSIMVDSHLEELVAIAKERIEEDSKDC